MACPAHAKMHYYGIRTWRTISSDETNFRNSRLRIQAVVHHFRICDPVFAAVRLCRNAGYNRTHAAAGAGNSGTAHVRCGGNCFGRNNIRGAVRQLSWRRLGRGGAVEDMTTHADHETSHQHSSAESHSAGTCSCCRVCDLTAVQSEQDDDHCRDMTNMPVTRGTAGIRITPVTNSCFAIVFGFPWY